MLVPKDKLCMEVLLCESSTRVQSVIDIVTEFYQNILCNLHTSSQMHVPLVYCRKSSLSFSRTALSHRQPATLSDSLWSRHDVVVSTPQITMVHCSSTSTQWTTLSVASPNTMSTSPVCSKCQWTQAASVNCLVRRGTEYHWQCN